jgi:glucose/arabinose dehydrogenase
MLESLLLHLRQLPALLAALAIACSLCSASALAQVFDSEQQRFRLKVVSEGLEHPWSLAFLPDGRMLVSERPGRLRLVDANGRLDPEALRGLPPIAAVGQGGLLDVVLHPDYHENGWIYLSYVGCRGRAATAPRSSGRGSGQGRWSRCRSCSGCCPNRHADNISDRAWSSIARASCTSPSAIGAIDNGRSASTIMPGR